MGRRRALSAPVAAGALVRLIGERFPDVVSSLWTDEDTVEITIPGARNLEVLRTLRDDPELAFWMLADEAGVDYGPGVRFEVVYHLYSDLHPAWLRVRATVDRDDPSIPSITGLWEGAMFHEREMYDMLGIIFEGNRDLRRLYMSPDYKSFPQRRDFLLPDDAADSPAAGVNPLERPETWDLVRFANLGPLNPLADAGALPDASAVVADPAGDQPEGSPVEAGETDADASRPR
ncbi:MAG TPA: NADH-quinone oxidoreductase subunit C [Chloroflexota bacterium]|nr:NADH-quinone oxidoreductase subunit C [Chloroflexota bacterium]